MKGEDIFKSIPLPDRIPRNVSYTHHTQYSTYMPPPRRTPVNVSSYYAGQGGGCFGGESTVQIVHDDEFFTKMIQDVRNGDVVQVAEGSANVICVAKIKRSSTQQMVTTPEGLTITPKHPVLESGEWKYARDLYNAKLIDANDGYVYNFVLSSSHLLIVNGITAITWSNMMNLPIGKKYYSYDILDALMKMPGWNDGYVIINAKRLVHEYYV